MILIAKGFGIARQMLERNEVTTIALIMGIVYLAYSSYYIAADKLIPIVLTIDIGILYLVLRYGSATRGALVFNLRQLRNSEEMHRSLQTRVKLIITFID
jgi:formate-dependent nitrite reductase membrane component NrfD